VLRGFQAVPRRSGTERSTALEITATDGSNSPVEIRECTARRDTQLYGSRNGVEYRSLFGSV